LLFRCENVDGILADLGVSSHQFDVPERVSTRLYGIRDEESQKILMLISG
jgi:hypothetical protein